MQPLIASGAASRAKQAAVQQSTVKCTNSSGSAEQWKRTEDWCGAEQGAPAAQFLHLLLLVGALTTWRQAGGGEQELTGQATYLAARCVMQQPLQLDNKLITLLIIII